MANDNYFDIVKFLRQPVLTWVNTKRTQSSITTK